MLTVCVKTTYLEGGSDIYRQEEEMAMVSLLSPVLANIYMEYFEEMALGSTSLKLSLWLRYVDDPSYLGRRSNTTGSGEFNSIIYTVY